MLSRFALSIACLAALPFTACAASVESPAPTALLAQASIPIIETSKAATQTQRFKDWKDRFIEQAADRGYDRASVTALIAPAKINEKALDRDSKQPEFSRPIWEYVDGAASADRLAKGKGKLAAHSADFDLITARYPVERNILTAIWGLESAYGRIQGDHNIIDALSTPCSICCARAIFAQTN